LQGGASQLSICAEGGAKNSPSARHACARPSYGLDIYLALPDIVVLVVLATLAEFASGSAGTIMVVTAGFAGFARAGAVLRKLPDKRIEWATAVGFATGAAITLLLVCVDVLLKWS
jgi:hypothetical protein